VTNVGRDLRSETLRESAAQSADERVRAALLLGDEAVALYARHHGLSEAEATAILTANRQKGRRYSRCLQPD
jgi:hypothetical protein